MLRRSSRLESTGYYDSEGEPSISYKETLYRIFRRRKTSSQLGRRESTRSINGDSTSNSMINDNSISNRNTNRDTNSDSDSNDNSNSYSNSYSISDSYSYSYRNRNYRNSYSYRYSNRDTIGNSDASSVGDRNSNSERNSNSRGPTKSKLKMLGFFFIILPLCFGFAFLIPTLSTSFLDLGPPESPAPTTITDTDLNSGCQVLAQHLRELQDELLRLKKYLLPAVATSPNFALEMQGASILYQLTSETYTQKAGLTFFGIQIWQPYESPRTVIQGHSPLVPGRCWPFAGGRGQLFIALSHRVTISHVTLDHISKSLSPAGYISSAPKTFSVYGMKTLHDEGTQLGTFLYDQDGDPVQTFKLPDHKKGVFAFVKLQVESNWGHPDYTCLYGFRVHGQLAN